MYPDTRLQFSTLKPALATSQAPADAGHILGMSHIGQPVGAPPWPTQPVLMPLLGNSACALQEYWHSTAPIRRGQFGDIHFSKAAEDVLYGVITLEESSILPTGGASALQLLAEQAYRQLFALLAAENCQHLWRIWNYIPRINAEQDGLERYRLFNIGRHQAFAACARPVDSSPAACALGTADGPVSLAFLASTRPALALENPRQVSAFAYPRQYGPRSPTFSRAALASQQGEDILFISGTASIVGHATLHQDDVAAQTRETFANITILLDEAQRQHAAAFTLQQLDYRVYIRHAADYPAVRAAFLQCVGDDSRAVYVQADICRADLLVEIEAQGFRPRR